MKKIISTLLSFSILFSTNIVWAEKDTEKMEQILVSVKNRIGDTTQYATLSYDSYSDEYQTSYSFQWESTDDDYYKYLNVIVLIYILVFLEVSLVPFFSLVLNVHPCPSPMACPFSERSNPTE